jgi:hypothetical protein
MLFCNFVSVKSESCSSWKGMNHNYCGLTPVVTDVAGDHDSKNQESTAGDCGAPHCSCFFSYSYSVRRGGRYSCSTRSIIAIRPIGPQVAANGFDQRSASPQLKQPSSTSTVSLSTVSLSTASLSTSTTKSDARHERPC